MGAKFGWLSADFLLNDSAPIFDNEAGTTCEVISLVNDEVEEVEEVEGVEEHQEVIDSEDGPQEMQSHEDVQGDVEDLGLNGIVDEATDDLPPFFKESMGSKKRQSFARRSLRAQLKFDPDDDDEEGLGCLALFLFPTRRPLLSPLL